MRTIMRALAAGALLAACSQTNSDQGST